jgi:hypothetical protein
MKTKKKKGVVVIRNWQLHHLSSTQKAIEAVYPGTNAKPLIFSGTVVDDPTGRWKPGYHMHSSLIVKMTKNTDNSHTVETLNTMYKLVGEGGDDVLPDMGDHITSIFY